MLKTTIFLGLIGATLVLSPAFAQSNPPPDQGPPPAVDQGAPGAAAPSTGGAMGGGKPSAKDLIASCRNDSRAKGLRGDALKSAVHDCVAAQSPKAAARLDCRLQGKAQGKSGDDLKAFVRSCMAQGNQ